MKLSISKTVKILFIPSILFFCIVSVFSLKTRSVEAAEPQKGWKPEIEIPVQRDGDDASGYVSQLYKFISMIVGALGAMMFMIGGFQYLISAGNTAAVAQAKQTMFSALAGIIIVLTAYLLLRIINKELVDLEEPQTSFTEVVPSLARTDFQLLK